MQLGYVGLYFVEVSDAELDKDTYEAAEKQYCKTIKNKLFWFCKLCVAISKRIECAKSQFLFGTIYFADNLENNAIPSYEYVISKPRSEFTEQALVKIM
jgi:hypothetical protein